MTSASVMVGWRREWSIILARSARETLIVVLLPTLGLGRVLFILKVRVCSG